MCALRRTFLYVVDLCLFSNTDVYNILTVLYDVNSQELSEESLHIN